MKIRIVRRQRINKVQYEVGDEPEFPEVDAGWLIEQGFADSLDEAAPRAVSKAPAAAVVQRPVFQPAAPRWGCCGRRSK